MKSRFLAACFLCLCLSTALSAAVETYAIDPVHSTVGFTIRHFVARVSGSFTKFGGTLVIDRDNLEKSSVDATIDVDSITTANSTRDGILKNDSFFAAEKHPRITFKSRSWMKTGDNTFDIIGDLTIKGITRQVVLHANLLGFGPGMKGAQLCGWEASATINKGDFGVNGPAYLGKALGDEVAVYIAVEGDLKK